VSKMEKGLNIMVLAHPGGSGWEFSIFRPKKRGLRNQRKFLSIRALFRKGRALKNVLTAKKGLFWGVLAEKRGVRQKKNDVCSRVFALLRGLLSRKPLRARTLRGADPLQKNRA